MKLFKKAIYQHKRNKHIEKKLFFYKVDSVNRIADIGKVANESIYSLDEVLGHCVRKKYDFSFILTEYEIYNESHKENKLYDIMEAQATIIDCIHRIEKNYDVYFVLRLSIQEYRRHAIDMDILRGIDINIIEKKKY